LVLAAPELGGFLFGATYGATSSKSRRLVVLSDCGGELIIEQFCNAVTQPDQTRACDAFLNLRTIFEHGSKTGSGHIVFYWPEAFSVVSLRSALVIFGFSGLQMM
jgi:hypothetical protein